MNAQHTPGPKSITDRAVERGESRLEKEMVRADIDDFCLRCGKRVPRRAVDYRYQDGTTGFKAGERLGSIWMSINDPKGYFCTMRCAARYAIAKAEGR